MQPTSNPIPKKYPILIAIIALLGFIDATYLSIEHFLNRIPPCTALAGCETVLTSEYATIAGIPVALVGAIFYLIVLVLAGMYLDSKKPSLLKIASGLATLAFIATLGFVYLQLFVIKAICLYCMGSAITSTLLFIVAVILFVKYFKNKTSETISSQV